MIQTAKRMPTVALALAIFPFASTVSNASEIVVEPAIAEVKIYLQGAEVIRTFRVDVPQGKSRIVVLGLPPGVSDFEAHTSQPNTDVRVVDTRQQIRYTTRPFSESIVEIEGKIDAVKQEIRQLEDNLKTIELELEFVQNLVDNYPTHNVHKSENVMESVGLATRVLNLVRDSNKNALGEQRTHQLQLDAAELELDRLIKERNDMGGKQAQFTELSLGIVAAQGGETEFLVSYFTRESVWRPSYQAYLDSATKRVTLLQDAIVRQGSPESWQSVKMTLTTANPQQDADPPELFSHFVDLIEPQLEAASERFAVTVTGSRLPMAARALMSEADLGVATPISFNYTTEYLLNGEQSVANNESDHGIVGLGVFEFENVELTTTVIPRYDDLGFLTARFTYIGENPLPSGSLRCFVDGSFVGRVQLYGLNSNDEVSLPLGRDERIEISLEYQGGTKGREGFLRNRKVEETHFVVNLRNGRSTQSSVEVLDYYPVSRHEDVDVEIHRDATPPDKTEIDNRPGRIAWTKVLEPNQSWTIVQRYSVSYPRDSNISTTQN